MPKLLKQTKSFCPACLNVIPADILEYNNRVYVTKRCIDHGSFEALHPWSNPEHYKATKEIGACKTKQVCADGLVLNINSNCNQNCPFCFARANEYSLAEPTIDQIKSRASKFQGNVIYLSGGEPALREDIFDIIKEIKGLGFKVFLFSNGKKLSDVNFVEKLKASGIDFVILQFDTLNEDQQVTLRGEQLVDIKLRAVSNLKKYRIPVYLFAMLAKDINTNQVYNILEFAVKNRDCIKIVNFNPVWAMGRYPDYKPMDASDILSIIAKNVGFLQQDFFDISLLSYYVSGILGLLAKKYLAKYPKCELRCYFIIDRDNKLISLAQLTKVKCINMHLKKIYEHINYYHYLKAAMRFALLLIFLLKEIVLKSRFRGFAIRCVFNTLLFKPADYKMSIISIIAGTFHTALNIDLDFVKTCNLYSDYPDPNKPPTSSCVRQITVLKELEGINNI
jgi:7,8-dihydro-6-hydroxymethylpterin dimethyltransferase